MKYYSNRKNSEGFTLVEVLIAILLLTVGLLALVSVTVMVIKGNSMSQMVTTATTLAKDQLEIIKNTSQIDDTSFNSIASSTWSDVTELPGGYQRQWTVTTNADNSKNIEMKVRWQWQGSYPVCDNSGIRFESCVTLNTIIAKP